MSWKTTQPSLLVRVRDPADEVAWSEFDRCYGQLIVRYGQSRGLQSPDAEDVRQVVMISLASALRSFEYDPERGRFRTYLGRVVRNAVNRHLARRPHRADRALESIEPQEIGDDGALDEAWEREWTLHHLRLAMQTVRQTSEPRSLEIFERLLAGQTPSQVAEEQGMSVAAVHKVKQRMRDRLRQCVEAQIRDEEAADAGAP